MTTGRAYRLDGTNHGHTLSMGAVHFDSAKIDRARAAQRAARDADIETRRSAMRAADKVRAARRVARDAKYFEVPALESDGELLARLWTLQPTDF